jgi:hypothetical protein
LQTPRSRVAREQAFLSGKQHLFAGAYCANSSPEIVIELAMQFAADIMCESLETSSS